MSHECEECGMQCYCDMDDCGGFEQPSDCPHIVNPEKYCDAGRFAEGDEFESEEIPDALKGEIVLMAANKSLLTALGAVLGLTKLSRDVPPPEEYPEFVHPSGCTCLDCRLAEIYEEE